MSPLETIQCPVLVGRDDVLALAERRLAETARGTGRTLLVAGEAGIGKSRVMGAIRRQARATGFREIQAEIAPQDHEVPAALLLDLARTMRDTPALADVGQAILDRWNAAISEGGATYSRAFVLDVVDRIRSTIDAPTLLVFEDLQWADDLSLEAIGELARRAGSMPLLVLAAYRRDETLPGTPLRNWRSRLLTQRLAEEVRLERLDLAQTATVTTLLLATGLPAPAEVVREVHLRSDGVPLHIEELFAAVRMAGPIDASAIRDVPVPDSIEDAVQGRLARRSADAQAVARAGAVIGRCFVPDVLAGVMDRPVGELAAPLQELVDHAFLYTFGAVDDGHYDFRHQLLRDALYRSTPEADLRAYHARAGEFGGALDGATQVHASLHYERAGRREAAFRAALAGAQEAARLSAHREAFGLYQRAVANMPADLPDLQRAELLEHLSDEGGAIERTDVAEDAARRAAEAYRAAGRPDRALFILGALLTYMRRMGTPLHERRALGEGILADFEALPPGEMRDEGIRWTLLDLLIADVDSMELDAAVSAAADLGATARAAGDHGLELAVAARAAMAAILGGDPDGGLASLIAVADEARAARHEETGVTAYRDAALHASRALDYAAAEQCLSVGREYADSIQQSHCAHVMGAIQAEVDWAAGRWDLAVPIAEQTIVDHGCARAPAMAGWWLGAVLLGRGDTERARDVLMAALAFGDRSEQLEWRLPPRWGLAELALVAGDPATAVRWCDEALSLATERGDRIDLVPFVVTGVRANAANGRPAAAQQWLAACEAHLEATPAFGQVALHHARGLVALHSGSTSAARLSLEAAVAGWDTAGRVWEATLARLDLASCLARSNRFAAATAVAVQAREVAERLPSPYLLARADELIRSGRGRIVEDDPWRPLTAREFAVARLIAEGHTNVEIADELGIAPKTASSHVEHILAKLGASRRAEIAVWVSAVDRSLPGISR